MYIFLISVSGDASYGVLSDWPGGRWYPDLNIQNLNKKNNEISTYLLFFLVDRQFPVHV